MRMGVSGKLDIFLVIARSIIIRSGAGVNPVSLKIALQKDAIKNIGNMGIAELIGRELKDLEVQN